MKHVWPPVILALSFLVPGSFTAHAQRAAALRPSADTPQARRATDALNLLEAQGYCADLQEKQPSAFAEFRQQGSDFVATIAQKDRRYTVTVNPETGRVSRQSE